MRQEQTKNIKKKINDPQFAKQQARPQPFAFQDEAMENYNVNIVSQLQKSLFNADMNSSQQAMRREKKNVYDKQKSSNAANYAIPAVNHAKRENLEKNENELHKKPAIHSSSLTQQHRDLMNRTKSLERHEEYLRKISTMHKEELGEQQYVRPSQELIEQRNELLPASSSKIVGTNDYSSISSSNSNLNFSLSLKDKKKSLKNPLLRHITKSNLPRIDPIKYQTVIRTASIPEQATDSNKYFSLKRSQTAQQKKLSKKQVPESIQSIFEGIEEQRQERRVDFNINQNEQVNNKVLDLEANRTALKNQQPDIKDRIEKELNPFQQEALKEDDRSRQRTEKQKNNDKYRVVEKEREIFDSRPLGEKMKRSMNDIKGQQLRTSYALTKKSFKWSSKVKTLLFSKKRTQTAQTSLEQVANEVYNDLDYQQDSGLSSENSIDIEEEGEIGELNEYKMKVLRASQKASTVEKGLKFKQNRHMRELQMKNQIFKAHNESLDIENQNNEADEALHEFLGRLSQKGDLRTSVEKFGEAMTLFFQLKEQFEQGINSESFVLSASIGKGSFGQVDLYFLKANSQLQSNFGSNSLKETASQSDAKIISSEQANKNNSMQKMSVNFSLDNQISNQSSQGIVIKSSKFQQIQLNKADSGLFGSIQPLPGIAKVESNQIIIEQSTPLREENGKYIFQKCMPVAGKKIKNLDEFTRELFIMQNVQCEYMPKLIFADLEKQLLFMELGLCSLEELKQDSDELGYTFSDEFTYQILVQIIKAIESLLSHIDVHSNKSRPLFHSDIKPSNIMLTVKKYPGQPNCSIKLLLIDFGGASFAIDDYWAFFTPAFVCSTLYQKLVQNQHICFHLTWEEIRFAEVYAACRSVQFLLIPDSQKHLFQQEKYEQFLQEKSYLYPKTCSILSAVFRSQEQKPSIRNIYENILSPQDKSLYTGLNPQNISFESQKIFQLSKFYTESASKQQY